MRTIKCDFKTQDLNVNSDLYKILKHGRHSAKLWALYGCSHLTNQHFQPLCLELITEPANELTILRNYIYNINGTFFNSFKTANNLAMEYWDFFNPNIRKRIKLIFNDGSLIKSMVIR